VDPQHPTLGGGITRLIQVGKGPLLRLSGAGFVSEDPLEWVGAVRTTGSGPAAAAAAGYESALIEVEGRAAVATGHHRFRNQVFTDAPTAFRCLAGYYEGDKFQKDENHADNTIVDGCEFTNIGTVFLSENQQALAWKFRDPIINALGDRDCIFADIIRGGSLTIDGLVINHPRMTIFTLHEYSPNNCQLTCRNFWRDRPSTDDNYLTLVNYAGPAAALSFSAWNINISGFIPATQTKFDRSKLYIGCAGLPRENWREDIAITGYKPSAASRSQD
jgi:hypothetical protein